MFNDLLKWSKDAINGIPVVTTQAITNFTELVQNVGKTAPEKTSELAAQIGHAGDWVYELTRAVKEGTGEAAFKQWFNQSNTHCGQITALKIDTAAKTIHVELDLNGDERPLQVDSVGYKLLSRNGNLYLNFGDIKTSHEWINLLVISYTPPAMRCIKISEKWTSVAKAFL